MRVTSPTYLSSNPPRTFHPTSSRGRHRAPRRGHSPLTIVALSTMVALVASVFLPLSTASAATLVSDGFDRSLTGTWGSADVGGAWGAATGRVTSRVTTGEGRLENLEPGQDSRIGLTSAASLDVVVHAGVIVPDRMPLYYSVEARRQADGRAYRARIVAASNRVVLQLVRVDSSGAIAVLQQFTVPATTAVPGNTLIVELETTSSSGVTLRARSWASGGPTPGWQASVVDSSSQQIGSAGLLGLHAYLSTAAAQPVTVRTTSFWASTTDQPSGPTPPTTAPPPSSGVRGSAVVGSTVYPVPAGALFVSPSGSDSNAGTQASPKRTVQAAVSAAPTRATVVLRAGVYHESVSIAAGRGITVQSYPHEAVWFDGSSTVQGFTGSGGRWSAAWGVVLDHSPTFSRGAPDGKTPGWQFVNPAHPMAAYPDQVWLEGQELRQVQSSSQLTPGTFFVDTSGHRLWVGSDPNGKSVVSSDLVRAFSLSADDTTLRGVGIRRYADSVPDQGVVNVHASRVTLEHDVIQDSATGAIGLFGSGNVLRNLTVVGSGQLGVQGDMTDGIVIANSIIGKSNDEQFNQAPSAGGIKLTKTRGITLSNNEISDGYGNGFWSDEASYDVNVVNNSVSNNTGRGIFLELSSKAIVAGNLIVGNLDSQFMAVDTDKVSLWNNTIDGSAKAIQFLKDSRTPVNNAFARDTRRPFPDPDMPWTLGSSTIANNIVRSTSYLLDVEDWTHGLDASSIGLVANGNVYNQAQAGTPSWIVVWARGGTDPSVYSTLPGFTSARGQERSGRSIIGPSVLLPTYAPLPSLQALVGAVAQPLPGDVAAKVGHASGSLALGAWVS